MNISTFDDLLSAARAQAAPQRLLFVFAGAELPANATEEQRAAFAQGHGGELNPLMCVDKGADQLVNFSALIEESREAGPPWSIVFATALAGEVGVAPDSKAVEGALQRMVERVRDGDLDGMVPFDTTGMAVTLA